jgi:hypothetical protein
MPGIEKIGGVRMFKKPTSEMSELLLYRGLAYINIVIAILALAIFPGVFGLIVFIPLLLFVLYFCSGVRCSKCGNLFDPRHNIRVRNHCAVCGRIIDEKDEFNSYHQMSD